MGLGNLSSAAAELQMPLPEGLPPSLARSQVSSVSTAADVHAVRTMAELMTASCVVSFGRRSVESR